VQEFGGWTAMSWDDVARIAVPHGLTAVRDTLIHERSLLTHLRLEFVDYLRRRRLVSMEPLRHLDIIAVAREQQARRTLNDLWDRTIQVITETWVFAKHWEWDGGGYEWHRGSHTRQPRRGAHHTRGISSFMNPDDSWVEDRTGEPAFAAGIAFEQKKGRTIRHQMTAPERAPWRADLREAGFSIDAAPARQHVRVYRTMYLAELIAAGATVDQQARTLGDWVLAAFEALLSTPPRPAWASPSNEMTSSTELA
jgi:hypothetical protein